MDDGIPARRCARSLRLPVQLNHWYAVDPAMPIAHLGAERPCGALRRRRTRNRTRTLRTFAPTASPESSALRTTFRSPASLPKSGSNRKRPVTAKRDKSLARHESWKLPHPFPFAPANGKGGTARFHFSRSHPEQLFSRVVILSDHLFPAVILSDHRPP